MSIPMLCYQNERRRERRDLRGKSKKLDSLDNGNVSLQIYRKDQCHEPLSDNRRSRARSASGGYQCRMALNPAMPKLASDAQLQGRMRKKNGQIMLDVSLAKRSKSSVARSRLGLEPKQENNYDKLSILRKIEALEYELDLVAHKLEKESIRKQRENRTNNKMKRRKAHLRANQGLTPSDDQCQCEPPCDYQKSQSKSSYPQATSNKKYQIESQNYSHQGHESENILKGEKQDDGCRSPSEGDLQSSRELPRDSGKPDETCEEVKDSSEEGCSEVEECSDSESESETPDHKKGKFKEDIVTVRREMVDKDGVEVMITTTKKEHFHGNPNKQVKVIKTTEKHTPVTGGSYTVKKTEKIVKDKRNNSTVTTKKETIKENTSREIQPCYDVCEAQSQREVNSRSMSDSKGRQIDVKTDTQYKEKKKKTVTKTTTEMKDHEYNGRVFYEKIIKTKIDPVNCQKSK